MPQRPQLRGKSTRRRLEQRGQVDVIGAKPHAVFAQTGARRLLQAFHFVGDFLPIENAELLDKLKRNTARNPGDIFSRQQFQQRPKQFREMGFDNAQPRIDRIARRAGQMFVGEHPHARPQNLAHRRRACQQRRRSSE